MTFAEETHQLAVHLARLLATPGAPLDETGYHQALLARGTTLALARDVHQQVVGSGQGPTTTRAWGVASTLSKRLSDHQGLTGGLSVTQVLAARSTTPAGEEWRHAARHALLADHDWREGRHPAWAPARAWSVLADAAALTEAVATLDRDLASTARSLGRDSDAAVLRGSAASGLREAAVEVQALARFGPLAAVHISSTRSALGQVVMIRSDADLPAASSQLFTALTGAAHLRPEHAVQIALSQARGAAVLASVLRTAPAAVNDRGVQQLATALQGAARALGQAATAPGRTASLRPGDPRPLLQAGELVRYLIRPDGGRRREMGALVEYARTVPDVVTALFDVARRQTTQGHWLVPSHASATTWSRFQVGLRAPALLGATAAVLAATSQVREAASALGTGLPRPSLVPAPRAVLRDTLTELRRQRPLPPPPPTWIRRRVR